MVPLISMRLSIPVYFDTVNAEHCHLCSHPHINSNNMHVGNKILLVLLISTESHRYLYTYSYIACCIF